MPERPTERQVVDWLTLLGRLVAANMPPDEASTRLRAYTPELLARYDSRDFNQASREFVARNCKFFPSYGELCELLDKWPKPADKPLPTGPQGSDLDAMDRSWIATWHKRRAEIFAQQTGFKWGSRDADLANLASLVREKSPKAWAVISGRDDARPAPPSEAEKDEVAAVVAAFTAKQHYPKSQPFPDQPKPSRDVSLKGDALRASRAARGLTTPLADEAA